ncbi:MAG TPA: TOBE domain-containing protein [Gallionellaceae bacterium]|nr:TOBE domain-containing protein [Gallionellaceae bacterium]
MNKLRGRITRIESNDHVSLVDVDVNGDNFTATLLETPEDAPYLRVGNSVDVLFKETEVSLAKGLSGLISLRNRVLTTVKLVRSGVILSEVVLDYRGRNISSIITTGSIKRLDIKPGDEVEALVKANEVTLLEIADGL